MATTNRHLRFCASDAVDGEFCNVHTGVSLVNCLLVDVEVTFVPQCKTHGALEAVGEQVGVCWGYDGDKDCVFA